MKCCLVHHAEAVGADVDPQRPLSERGLAQAEAMAGALQETGFRPAAIWHSGKLRARQTGAPFLRRCNALAAFRMVRGLRPDDPADWIAQELTAEDRDVLVVGHMPHISALARRLCPPCEGVPLHGFLILERTPEGEWRELGRGAP